MQSLSSIEQAALDHIDQDRMLAQVQAWAGINSGTGNLKGLNTTASLLADAFGSLPGKTDLVEPVPVEAVRSDGSIEPRQYGRHLVLSVRPQAAVQILLTGHMDTVFDADHPFQEQKWIADGVLNGPGVADMKGGLSVMLAALSAAEHAPVFQNIGYQVLVNSDEETGSLSSAPLIVQLAKGKIAALTYEPALPDGTMAGERGGSGNFSIIITGKSAHAGRNPQDGRNAIVAAADIAVRLKDMTCEGLSVNPARIEGGGPNNVVPDHAILRVNLRPATQDMEALALAQIKALVGQIAKKHDLAVHQHGGFGRPPKPIDAGARKLYDLVETCGTDLGMEIGFRSTGGVCDGNNIAACGVPVVDTMGVRGGNIHSSDEFLIVDSLGERARLSALTLIRIAEKGSL
jgi:glutamate carboxypeptidase